MIRGTTPILEFTLPFDTDLLAEAYVTITQNGGVILEKKLSECSRAGQTLSVRLTQEETLKLDHMHKTEIQVRARTRADDVFASDIFEVNTDRILKEGVI